MVPERRRNDIDVRDVVRTVTSNSLITASGIEKLSLKARKMLYIAISQCRKSDKEFYTYEITVKDFSRLMDVAESNVYQEADRITDELMAGFIQYREPKQKYFKKYQLFATCEYNHRGSIIFELNDQMAAFLLNLKKDFSQPLLLDFMKMRSPYSMAIWHLIQREMKSRKPGISQEIKFFLDLEELRAVTGTQNKLKQVGQFKERVFDKALREIYENCGVSIEYENAKRGRKIVGFQCNARSTFFVPEEEITSETKEKVKMFKEAQNSDMRFQF